MEVQTKTGQGHIFIWCGMVNLISSTFWKVCSNYWCSFVFKWCQQLKSYFVSVNVDIQLCLIVYVTLTIQSQSSVSLLIKVYTISETQAYSFIIFGAQICFSVVQEYLRSIFIDMGYPGP